MQATRDGSDGGQVQGPRGGTDRRLFYSILLLLVGVVVAYSRLFGGQFTTWDDDVWIEKNSALSPPSWQGLADKWTDAWTGRGVFQNLYTPVTHTMWFVAAQFAWTEAHGGPVIRGEGTPGSVAGAEAPSGRLDPVYFKTLSLGVHLAAAAGVFVLMRRLLRGAGGTDSAAGSAGATWAAVFGAGVFALHPMQVESVAWVSGLKDVLWTALAVWALVVFVGVVSPAGASGTSAVGRWGRLVGLWAVVAAALLTKPTAVVIPAMMLVVAWAVRGPGSDRWRRVALAVGIAVVLAVPVAALTARWQTAPLVEPVAWGLRPLVAMDALGHYVSKTVVPAGFALDYARSPGWVVAGNRWVWNAAVLGLVVVGLGVWRSRLAWAGAGLALLAVGPVLGFKPFDFATFSVVSDHYAYPLMVGVAVVVAAAVAGVTTWWQRRGGTPTWAWTVGMAVLVGLGVQTWRQVGTWRDSATLYQHGLAVMPRSAMMNSNYAAWLQTTAVRLPRREWGGMMEASLVHAQRAIDTFPKYPQANYLAGIASAFLGRPAEALKHYAVAAPHYAKYADFQAKLGDVYAELGRLEESARHYREALRLDPENASAQRMLPQILAAQQRMGTRPTTGPG